MKKIEHRFTLTFFVLISSFVRAQSVSPGLAELLSHTLDSMHTVVEAKSLSASVQVGSGAIWSEAVGIAGDDPILYANSEMVYEIGSVTKTLTAACILQLHDEGLLHIDDSISNWITGYENISEGITVRQLLQHTSGLYDLLNNPNLQVHMLQDVSYVYSAQELIENYLLAPIDQPNEGWSYCNTNYFLLGMIIESISGNPFYTDCETDFLHHSTVRVLEFRPLKNTILQLHSFGWICLEQE